MASTFGAVQLAHEFLEKQVSAGDICIDCTAGRGNDTVFLCELVGCAERFRVSENSELRDRKISRPG
ncbi:MAG: hypothetical protein IK990_05105 [Ruminiclostridium sp.]|nr:hypothetical protein [Ruminiclostridium sp.]